MGKMPLQGCCTKGQYTKSGYLAQCLTQVFVKCSFLSVNGDEVELSEEEGMGILKRVVFFARCNP